MKRGIFVDQLDTNGCYSYADYLQWEFEERVELIEGKLYPMPPTPGTKHQQYVGEIFRQISNHVHRSSCKVFVAPFDVRLTSIHKAESNKIYTVVQPDICVVCDPAKNRRQRLHRRAGLDRRSALARKHR